jgi:putative endonuclease
VPDRAPAFVYILRLRSGSLCVGCTRDVEQRWSDHWTGRACGTTRRDRPVVLAFVEPHPTFSSARHRESQLKRWCRAKKEALIHGDLELLRGLARRRGG